MYTNVNNVKRVKQTHDGKHNTKHDGSWFISAEKELYVFDIGRGNQASDNATTSSDANQSVQRGVLYQPGYVYCTPGERGGCRPWGGQGLHEYAVREVHRCPGKTL